MPWSKDNYPDSMKSLPAKTRKKAIEIANAMLRDGEDEGKAIRVAIHQAKQWAEGK